MYLTGIVLAAGCSSRLGQMKQLVAYQDTTLLERQIETLLPVVDCLSCVTGYQADKIPVITNPKVNYIVNSQWHLGLSSSIVAALSNVPRQTTHIVFLLSDQWKVSTADCEKIKKAAKEQPNTIVAAESMVEGRLMFSPPVLIPRLYFEEVKLLTGEGGAKEIIKKHLANTVFVEMPNAFDDIDTPEDLQNYKNEIRKEKELSNDQVKRKWQGSSV